MKTYKKYITTILIIALVFLINPQISANSPHIKIIKNLKIHNSKLKLLKKDIKKSLSIIKGKKNPSLLPYLQFLKYRVTGHDNFWLILSKTSLDIDTLMTVNSLSSPRDISPGKTIIIPNMRGIIHKTKKNESINKISKRYRIKEEYIYKVNKITIGKIKKYLFIPCARISNLERSFFMGVGFAYPLKKGVQSSNFGCRKDPFNKTTQFHTGIDIACPIGSKVSAARSGKIIFTGTKGGYGLLVIIKHEYNYYSYYGHLSKIFKRRGAHIRRGELIAFSGNSGRTTGPHLHFEIRKNLKPINPGILLR